MATDGIEFKFTSNERDLLRGAGDAEAALEDVADALDDVATAGEGADQVSFRDTVRQAKELEDAADDAGKALERGADKGGDEVDRLEGKLRDAERRTKELGDAGDRAGRDVKRGMDRASEGLDEFKDEAGSTARESAASFDGSFTSIADSAQEIAANAFGGFGLAGAAAGVAAAAGIGMVVAAFDAVNQAEEESRGRAAEWATAYVEAGSTVLTAQQRVAMLGDIVSDPQKWKDAQDNAREWGVSVSTAMRAMIGDTDALTAANQSLTQREREAAEAAAGLADGGEMLSEVLLGQTAETRNGREALSALQREMDAGAAGADAYAETLLDVVRTSGQATERVDELGNTIYELPGGVEVGVDANTGRATTNIEALSGRIRNIPDGQSNVRVIVDDGAADVWMRRDLNRFAYMNVVPVVRPGQRLAV